jgi:hypothetical protein
MKICVYDGVLEQGGSQTRPYSQICRGELYVRPRAVKLPRDRASHTSHARAAKMLAPYTVLS